MRTLIVFLIIFSVIVVIHEFGHYYFARRAGIKVREFSLGMGPKLFAKQGQDGTTYTVRMLPLGGYVRLAGLNEEDNIQPGMEVGLKIDENDQVSQINTTEVTNQDELPIRVDEIDLINDMFLKGIPAGQSDLVRYSVSDTASIIEPDGTQVPVAPLETRYESATPWEKFVTNFAGPINNFILSIIVYTIIAFITPGVPTDAAVIGEIVEDTPAASSELQADDEIVAVNNQTVDSWTDFVMIIQDQANETVELTVERNDEEILFPMEVATATNEQTGEEIGQIGVIKKSTYDSSFMSRITYGFTQTWAVITGVLSVIGGMFVNGFNINNFGGPIAMAQMTSQVVDYGIVPILSFAAYISANLGIFNLMPIPALDGGKLVMNVIEGIRGKPVSQNVEGIINLIGVVLILLLVVAVTWNDIQRAFF